MIFLLKNNSEIIIRLAEAADAENLSRYLQQLSDETKSRFGPHPFDADTVRYICSKADESLLPFIAQERSTGKIIAYLLVKKGMLEGDYNRYASRQSIPDPADTVTFAPSVADDWQGTGAGSLAHDYIKEELRRNGTRTMVLWGGVQADNERALQFYRKQGYVIAGNFWHEGKNNYDMTSSL